MEKKQELALVKKIQNGDKEAMAMLWDSINPKLYGYLLNVLRNREVAEDVLQETWIKVISSVDQFKSKGVRFSAWVFAIARNTCRDYWRKNKEQSVDMTEVDIASECDIASITNNNMEIERILSILKKEDKEIIRLRYIGQLSYKEIATVLEISIVSARVKIHRIIKKIQSELN